MAPMKPRSKSTESAKASGTKKSRANYGQESPAEPANNKAEISVREAVAASPGAPKENRLPEPEQRVEISHHEISERARLLWEREGRPEGRDFEIWLRAEAELKSERR